MPRVARTRRAPPIFGPAQVGLDQDHALAGERERRREVERGGRLALGRAGAGDHHGAGAAARSRRGARERGAQGSESLDAGGRELVRRDDLAAAAAALLRDAGQDRQPVERAQLLLAAQARVEHLGRERAADAEHEARR